MIELQPFCEENCDQLISWIPNARFLLQWAGPKYSWPLDRKQLQATLQPRQKGKPSHYMFKAVLTTQNKVIGHIQLMNVDHEKHSGHIGRVLIGDPLHRGKGYGKKMMELLVHFAFKTLNLHRLTLGVFAFNTSALACHKSLGFKQIEFRENARQFEGESWNLIMMELQNTITQP